MSISQPPATAPALPDRSTRLILFGIFQILLGCLCGLMALMVLAASAMALPAGAAQGQATNPQMLIPAMAFYLIAAGAFIWLGVGSFLARRWAWALTVVVSWMWLVMGVAGCVVFVFVAGPAMSASLQQQAKMPPEAIVMFRIITTAVVGCIYLLLPAIFLVFYSPESVWATCQRRDPRVRWTDRCPMPVLALSVLAGFSAVSTALAVLYSPVMPLFGFLLSGPAIAAVMLLLTLALAYFAWGTYRLQMAAWWGMLLLGILGVLNMVTIRGAHLMEMYQKMRVPAAQLEMMRKSGMLEMLSSWMPWMSLVSGIVWLGYLLYVRRYFVDNVARSSLG
jgi:MFS family permease